MSLKKLLAVLVFSIAVFESSAQTAAKPEVPDWALPGSATHKQIPPPADFHRPARTDQSPLGVFEGQSDVGAALVPGSSSYNSSTKQYTIVSAGYNIWYQRDEFRYVWKKMSGDISIAADVDFPDTAGYNDRKAVLVIRQSLDDDSKEVVVALHGAGLLHLAWRPEAGAQMKEIRANKRKGLPDLVNGMVKRIGLVKTGDRFTLYVSEHGEPMHAVGESMQLSFSEPFYVGIGFCSHLPATADTAVLSHVILANESGALH